MNQEYNHISKVYKNSELFADRKELKTTYENYAKQLMQEKR